MDNNAGIGSVSANRPAPKGAAVAVTVSSDKMSAFLLISAPEIGGEHVTAEQIRAAIDQKKVVFGIDNELLNNLAINPAYEQSIQFAKGQPAVNGEPAEIQYMIRRERELRPKERDDGTVDYRDLGIVENVNAEDVLCEKIPATPGTPGTDVLGQTVNPKPGKDCPIPMGKGTKLSENKLQLLATIDGQAEYVNHKINVLNTFTVEGSVSLETGNILFVGNVVVKGNVFSGFTVQASGNIDIAGMAEAANIIAEGDVIVRGGFNGMGKGRINAGGKVVCKYIQAGEVIAKESVETGYSYNANIHTGSKLRVVGQKGIIVGGHIMATESVESAFYGGKNSPVATTIEVGNDPTIITRSHEIPGEIETINKNLAAAKRLHSILLQLKAANRLDEEKAKILQKTVHSIDVDEVHLSELQEEYEQVNEKLLSTGYGKIIVNGAIFSGVRLIIGSEVLFLNKEYPNGKFTRGPNGIAFGP